MEEETRMLLEMEESECSSDEDDDVVIMESSSMPSLLQQHSSARNLATIREDQPSSSTATGALTFVLAYGMLLALVMGFCVTVVATAPCKLTSKLMTMRSSNEKETTTTTTTTTA